jgi:hypothetical protein
MSLSSREKSNLTRWNARQKPFYEVYYLKWSDPAQSVGAWVRYTLLSSIHRPPEASVWAMFYDAKDPSRNAALKKTYPLKETRIERDFFYFAPGPSAIFDDGCRGELEDGKNRASWELKFQDKGDPLWYFPRLLYKTAFPKTKFVVPYLSTRISGEFTWNDRRWTLHNVPAHQGHLWGTEHAENWIWANANTFSEDPSFCFEGLSAQVRLGEKTSPPLTLLFFQWEGRLYRCNSPRQWFVNRSVAELDRWHFEAVSGDSMFVGDYNTSPDRMIAVRYEDPAGGERFSHHTETASVRIQILKKSKAGWETVKILRAEDSAAFEVVRREHDPRVKLLLP